jgi:DNA-directed RNA polymerase subunit beta
MLTIKSDDTVGRVKAYEAIVKGENIAEPSIPESFKVLLKEMQSLGLDVNVVSEEGERAEMREEDDDLLRAAEELGIDLSGVRAADGGAADEATEHKGETLEASEEETESEDPDLESGQDLEAEDLATTADPMLEADVPAGDAEGVLEEDEA